MRPLPRRSQTRSSQPQFNCPGLEALEDRLTPSATPFYWKLQSASPVVDPDNARPSWNYTHSGSDPISGSYTDNSSLILSHGPDEGKYSDVYSNSDGTAQTTKVSAAWSGAPGIILPGQFFTISESIKTEIDPNSSAGVSVSAYGLTVHGLSGVKLNLFTSKTGQEQITGPGNAGAQVNFTAPKTQNADFPNPVGITPNKPVSHLVIFEYFGFLGNTGATAVEYMYDEVIGVPPHLAFTAPLAGASVGTPLAPIVLSLTNAPAGSIVTLALGNKPDGAVLSGSLTAPVIAGQATFRGLSINVPGNYTLVASSLGLTTTSQQFQMGDQLKFVEQPLKYVLGTDPITVSIVGIAPDGKIDPFLKLSDVGLKVLNNGVSSPQQAAGKVANGVIQYTLNFDSTSENLQLAVDSPKAFANATSNIFADVLSINSVWTGNGTKVKGGNANWDNPLNWDIGQPPQSGAGQSLIFPSNAINKSPIDNMPKPTNMDRFTIRDISIMGNYGISGTQPLAIAGNITVSPDSDAHLGVPDVLFANQPTLTAGNNSRLTLEGNKGIAGQVMTAQGAGTIVLNCLVANDVIIPGGTNGSGNLEFGQKLQGLGKVTMNGGTLKGSASNAFQGLIEVAAGTIRFGSSSASHLLQSPLGVGSLILKPAGGQISIDPGSAGYVNLANKTTFDMQMGKTSFNQGTVFFLMPVNIKSPSELATGTAAVVGITDVSSDTGLDNLTITGAGTTNFVGILTANVFVGGKANLSGKFAGTGKIVLTDNSSVLESRQANTFSGTINVQKGSILIGGTSPLGTGELDLGSSGQAVTIKIGASATLTNQQVILDNTTVTVQPSQTTKNNAFTFSVAGAVQVKNPSTFGAPAGANVVNLKGAITGAALTLDCTAILGGTLSVPLFISDDGAVSLDTKFGGTGNITVQGGALSSANNVKAYSGSVALVSGVIGLGSTAANLGVGSLSLLSGFLRLPVGIATLTNANMLFGSIQISAYAGKTPVPVAGGKLKISAPVTFGTGSEIDPLTGTVVTLSGVLTGSCKVGGKGEIDRPKSFQAADQANKVFTILAGAKLVYF